MNSIHQLLGKIREFYEGRHEPENMRPLAEWYWRTLLSLSILGIGLIIAFGAWEFYKVIHALSAGDSLRRSAPPEILSRKELTDILSAYESRQAEFDAAKSAPVPTADPSR